MDCPSLVNKEKGQEKKKNRAEKTRRSYISWEDNYTSTSSSSKEVKANLCLMAKQKLKVSSVDSSTSFNNDNYSSLLQAFLETHEEANRSTLSNNQLKGLNNWLEGRVKELEDELLKFVSTRSCCIDLMKPNQLQLKLLSLFGATNYVDQVKTNCCQEKMHGVCLEFGVLGLGFRRCWCV